MEFLKPPILMYHTFISYQSSDSKAAVGLTHMLQDLGLRPWWYLDSGDRDQAPRMSPDIRGKPIPGSEPTVESALGTAIAYSILVTVITSPHTLQSVWVRKEIELARRWQKPLFFWHVVVPGEADQVSMRYGGGLPGPDLPWDKRIEAMAGHYERKPMASPASIEFMQKLLAQEDLNIIGHIICPLSEIESVCGELNALIELGELVLHNGEALNTDSVQQFWPEYDRLCLHAEELEQTIYKRFGRRAYARRTPVAHAFRLKRPYVQSRIRHLKRLLEDDDFREREFRKLDG